jgi:hypothetical protein
VNNFRLLSSLNVASFGCATNSSHPNSGVEIFEPGLGLLLEQNPLAGRPISFERSPRILFLGPPPGFSPGLKRDWFWIQTVIKESAGKSSL